MVPARSATPEAQRAASADGALWDNPPCAGSVGDEAARTILDVEVRFKKGNDGRTCSWVALRPPRTRVPGPTMAAGGDVPHDPATFVIEEAQVNEVYFAWRNGTPTSVDEALDQTLEEWRRLPDDGELVRQWTTVRGRQRRRR